MESDKKKPHLGWLWVIVLVIIAAAILFLTQQQAPDSGKAHITSSTQVLKSPTTVSVGEDFYVSWLVDGPEETAATHSAVHYGPESMMDNPGNVGPAETVYPSFIPNFTDGEYSIPNNFQGLITAPNEPGKLYLRSHAVIDGKNYWSDESTIIIK